MLILGDFSTFSTFPRNSSSILSTFQIIPQLTDRYTYHVLLKDMQMWTWIRSDQYYMSKYILSGENKFWSQNIDFSCVLSLSWSIPPRAGFEYEHYFVLKCLYQLQQTFLKDRVQSKIWLVEPNFAHFVWFFHCFNFPS